MSDKNKFTFTYSAPTQSERKEIESIRKRYLPHSEISDMERLKELDNKANRIPTAVAIAIGIIGTLIFGFGLALILEWNNITVGLIIAVIGISIFVVAYPIYKAILSRNRIKYGTEILKLCDKLLQRDEEK